MFHVPFESQTESLNIYMNLRQRNVEQASVITQKGF